MPLILPLPGRTEAPNDDKRAKIHLWLGRKELSALRRSAPVQVREISFGSELLP